MLVTLNDLGRESLLEDIETINAAVKDCRNAINLSYHSTVFQIILFRSIQAQKRTELRITGLNLVGLEKGAYKISSPHVKSYPETKGDSINIELEAHRLLLRAFFDEEIGSDDVIPRMTRDASTEKVVLLAPFGSSPIRDINPYNLIPSLLKIAACGYLFNICFPPEDKNKCQVFANEIQKGANLNITLKSTPSIKSLISEIQSSSVIKTTESAPAHLAISLNKPTVALSGGGHSGMFDSWVRSQKQIWVTNRLPCFYCNWNCIYKEARCVTEISADSIQDAIEKVIYLGA